MPKSYRIRTQPGVDKNIKVEVSQDFDFLEILSLKLRQEDVYTRFCADYGVVVGRVITNGGYGLPNAKVSVFVPLDSVDENDPIISTLYPYKNIGQKNEDGYRYNLLPYEQSYGGHTPTGTFPTEDDILTRQEVLEVYEKYYKYTVKTNESGDFMIIGVPLGIQKVVMDLDLSDMGCFSLRPSDLIRMGLATDGQVAGQQFRASTDLETLPQIINAVKDVDVASFWGQEDLCTIGISRVDFDLRDYGVDIKPHAIFMGSLFSNTDEDGIKENCAPKRSTGKLCEMVTSPGKILAIRHTIDSYKEDNNEFYPILEEYKLENGGNIIDSDGTWLVEVPMNLDYVVTNEFGEQVLSSDPSIGIPTKGKYRFKIEYQNEGGLQNEFQRANYLVPNVREYVKTNNPKDPGIDSNKSYAFSLDWKDYADTDLNGGITIYGRKMIQEAIDCKDRFYEFNYNKVYTVSSHIDRFKYGLGDLKHIGIKNIDDSICKSSVNRFPVNDGEQNSGNLFFFDLLMLLLKVIFIPLILVMHIVYMIYGIIALVINLFIWLINTFSLDSSKPKISYVKQQKLTLPMISYPDCESCPCDPQTIDAPKSSPVGANQSLLANINDRGFYNTFTNQDEEFNNNMKWILAGNESGNLQRVPFYKEGIKKLGYTTGPTLAQKINLLNQRSRYFVKEAFDYQNGVAGATNKEANIIKTTVKNNKPGTNTADYSEDPLYDNVMVLFCDSNTLSTLGVGTILTFSDIESINDPNTTGATENQYGNTSVTGTTKYDKNNLVTATIDNILPDGTKKTTTLKILSDENEKYYNFKSGVEYFQIITGGTVSEYRTILNNIPSNDRKHSVINNYIINYTQQYFYKNGLIVSQSNSGFGSVKPVDKLKDSASYEIIFLTRGVDPYTKRQNIEYDLSQLFGLKFGNITVEGNYLLNIPIQETDINKVNTYYDYKSPESHNISNNTNNTVLFHPSYTFTADTNNFTAFTSLELCRYSSMDESKKDFYAAPNDSPHTPRKYSDTPTSTWGGIKSENASDNTINGQFRYDGAGLLSIFKNSGVFPDDGRFFSPVYYNGNRVFNTNNAYNYGNNYNGNIGNNGISINNSSRIVFRSDRLPTSDQVENHYQSSFPLHQNQKFAIYTLNDEGGTVVSPNFESNQNYKGTESVDFSGSTPYDSVISSLSCGGMVVTGAYEGYGTNLTINKEKNKTLITRQEKVVGGCYILVNTPIVTLIEDANLFIEWQARYRIMYAACQGAFAHMFQNNWVNGTLYMPTFNKGAIFNSDNEVKRYTYCGSPESFVTNPDGEKSSGAGPIYFNNQTNNFYYKSTKYLITQDKFIGQPEYVGLRNLYGFLPFGATNEYNIWYPTTIMDLGPRDQFTKQICFDPNFEGYLVDSLKSTSYQDTGDILNIFVISRITNSGFLSNLFNAKDSSINSYFSRDGDRIDGDMAQMWSINSEFGITPFLGSSEVYTDDRIFVSQVKINSKGDESPLFGIFFTGSTELRNLLTPGKTEYTNFGYPNTQEVPFYRWSQVNEDIIPAKESIFGTEYNNWDTTRRAGVNATDGSNSNGRLLSKKYQTLDFDSNDLYFKPNNGDNLGYIYNLNSSGKLITSYPTGQSNRFLVGAPFHFYFGLRKGKSAMNRFITKYMI